MSSNRIGGLNNMASTSHAVGGAIGEIRREGRERERKMEGGVGSASSWRLGLEKAQRIFWC